MSYELTYKLINNETEYEVSGYTGTPVNVVIPSIYNGKSVTSVGEGAFFECSSLTSVEIPDSVTSIGGYAFMACAALQSISIPNSVTTIGDSAFAFSSSLVDITMGASVTSIGEVAFIDCKSLKNIFMLSKTPAKMLGSAFGTVDVPDNINKVPANLKFYVYSDCIEVYKNATNWKTYTEKIVADDLKLTFAANALAQKNHFISKNESKCFVKTTDYAEPGVPGVVFTNNTFGLTMGWNNSESSKGLIRIERATQTDINNRTNQFRPITPSTMAYAVKDALANANEYQTFTGTSSGNIIRPNWTDEDRKRARETLGIPNNGGSKLYKHIFNGGSYILKKYNSETGVSEDIERIDLWMDKHIEIITNVEPADSITAVDFLNILRNGIIQIYCDEFTGIFVTGTMKEGWERNIYYVGDKQYIESTPFSEIIWTTDLYNSYNNPGYYSVIEL